MGKAKSGEIRGGNTTNVYENPDTMLIFQYSNILEDGGIEACELGPALVSHLSLGAF